MEAPKILQISSIAHISEKQCKEEFDKQGTSINHKFQSGVNNHKVKFFKILRFCSALELLTRVTTRVIPAVEIVEAPLFLMVIVTRMSSQKSTKTMLEMIELFFLA
jgi:Na+-transporting NADH:ubiquinone oxidoreductase subunit NqrD